MRTLNDLFSRLVVSNPRPLITRDLLEEKTPIFAVLYLYYNILYIIYFIIVILYLCIYIVLYFTVLYIRIIFLLYINSISRNISPARITDSSELVVDSRG